jgi:GNAT superfamily N-acetyltransferase
MTATQWALHIGHPLGAVIPVSLIPDGLRLEGYTAETDEEFRAVRNEAFQDEGSARLSAKEWRPWTVNANFRPELSFMLRDVETGTAVGILLTVCWEAEAAATGIRDAYLRIIATGPAYRKRGVAHVLISHTLRAAGWDSPSVPDSSPKTPRSTTASNSDAPTPTRHATHRLTGSPTADEQWASKIGC